MACGPFAPSDVTADVFGAGERYAPTVDPYSAAMHLGHMASYKLAVRYAYRRFVLDLGCGTGYGAHYLASFGAGRVIAVDVEPGALAYACNNYSHPRVHYLCLDGNQQLPFADGVFEFVFSSQVIEHIAEPIGFLAEIKRVLKPEGFCLITTPNKNLFSPGHGEHESSNEFHVSEMTLSEYERVGRAVFPRVEMAGIPQNCLKSTESLLEDFRMRKHNLLECENMLLFGHAQSDGQFDVTLPDTLAQASTDLAPCFWDADAGLWLSLGIYPEAVAPSDGVPGGFSVVRQRFCSPYNNLFRLGVALTDADSGPVEATVRCDAENGPMLFRAVLEPVGRKLHLVFDAVPDSAGRTFYLELRRKQDLLDALLAKVKRGRSLSVEYRGGELAFWTFHRTLPPTRLE